MNKYFHELLELAGIEIPKGIANPIISHITCNSKEAKVGSLFIGLKGENVDGGCFWPNAFSLGAVAAVISQSAANKYPPKKQDSVIIVNEPVAKWAGELASAFWSYPSSKLNLIGVTGTNGKTTISHLIEHLSKELDRPSALFGTLVNRWPNYTDLANYTTDFTDHLQSKLAKAVDAGAELAVMEVSSHALSQYRVAGCRFAGAIFTNLTQDHLDFHPSMDEYFEAKALLFRPPLLQEGNVRAVVNVDDPWGKILADRLGDCCWRSSLQDEAIENGIAELVIQDFTFNSGGVEGVIKTPVGSASFQSPLIGKFNLMNLLQSIGILIQQGFSLHDLLLAVSTFQMVPGRMERVVIGKDVKYNLLPTVLVDYAHTPDGLGNALLALRPFVKGKLTCIFGCGGDRDKTKRSIMGSIAAKLSDQVVITSDNPRTEDPEKIIKDIISGIPKETKVKIIIDRVKAIALTISESSSNDIVLIAGKGHEDYQIVGIRKIHLNDKEEAEKALLLKLESI